MAKVEIVEHKGHKFLFINNYLWMWDIPAEQRLQKELASQASGDVLVAGYGFGILQKFLLKNPKVKSVTSVEKYKEVIEKVKHFDRIYGKVIIADFYNLPENKKYDCVIGDIWPDIDKQFLKDYVKFKKKAEKLIKKNGVILAWGKEYYEYLLKHKKENNEKPTKRYHLILDAVNVKVDYLENENFLRKILKEVSKLIGMKIIYGPVIVKGGEENPGLSVFCIIDYSHISLHTFTKEKEFCFDVFSCRPFSFSKIEKYLIKKLRLKKEQIFKSIPEYQMT